jgi:retron-type reverse transcriptase
MRRTWQGIVWFIAGDLAPCFDSLDHGVLMSSLREQLQDQRVWRSIENLLKAGYLEPWVDHAPRRGAPPGGGVRPLRSNLSLDRVDQYVEQIVLPR